MDTKKQTLINAIPATGSIKYDALKTALVTTGNADALSVFHQMRRKGEIAVRTAREGGEVVLYVSRA